jgi:hypothetical protein
MGFATSPDRGVKWKHLEEQVFGVPPGADSLSRFRIAEVS